MDYLTEIEVKLASFTQALYQGVNEIQEKSETLDQQSRVKFVNVLSSDLLAAHSNVIEAINKIPEEIFTMSREAQENEIKTLELRYEQSVNRLQTLKSQAQNVYNALEQNLG